MDADDLEPRKVPETLKALASEDLALLGVEELEERIEALTAEIQRCRTAIDAKRGTRDEAEALFKR